MTALALAPNGVQMPSLSKMIDEWFGNEFTSNGMQKVPATNFIEKDNHFLIELSVPGRQKKDFEIKIDQNLLIITTQDCQEKVEEKENYRLKEFSSFHFNRSFRLSDTIQADKISATCRDGILKIHLPKKEEAKKLPPRQIDIK